MKRWQKILLAALVIGVVIVGWRWLRSDDESGSQYIFTEVIRTDLHATVSSTGTLSAVETVEVGTQVSGQVNEVYVDYNDQVERGQLLALIDTEALDASLEDTRARVVQAEAQQAQAEAQVAEAEANLADARATLERNQSLLDKGYLSESEFQPIRTALQTAEATVRRTQAALRSAGAQVEQARAQVTQALKDRRNAEIRAPIAGTVIERSVDAGQTVAASFETPTLFVLAENLQHMQILADVDESDIGRIEPGQRVTFNVPAYPDETYDGTVRAVRLQPNTSANVVTYTVVIDAANPDGHLLPGMTATVDFVTGEAANTLAISTAALQLQPTPQMMAAVAPDGPPRPGPGEARAAADTPDSAAPAPPPGGTDARQLWYVDDAGQLHTAPVRTGLSTGALTQIEPVAGADSVVHAGLQVIEQVLTDADLAPSAQRGPPRM